VDRRVQEQSDRGEVKIIVAGDRESKTMEQLVSSQRKYFNSNATKPVAFRLEQLNKLKSIFESNEGLLQEAIHQDFGKGPFETFLTESYFILDELNAALKGLQEWARVKPIETNVLNAPAKSYIIPEPLGVSLVIGPWNYPLQLALNPAIAAMAAGCTVVLKPSELTPNCSRVLARLITENFDREYLAVVEGGVPETTALLDQKFDVIFFTGSVPVGKVVYQAAAKHLTPVILELGGKSPAIVAADTHLDIAVRRLVWAKFLNAGQTCIAPDYVCVHQSVERQFLETVAREIKNADYKSENGNYVSMINEKNTSRVAGLIDEDKVYLGGAYDIEKRFIEPTVMAGVTWDDQVMQDEIFGPVLPVMAYDDLDEVIRQIKNRPKPLALYLFTQDEKIKEKVLQEVSFGGGCINEAVMHFGNGELPFGGVGDSGLGNYHGEAGFRAFSHYKSILDKEVTPDPDLKYSPYTDEKLEVLRSIAGLEPAKVG
jgi:aldehyde dehydrogenase (NAD+)